ncbi:porin [Basfia succiniciproducens]|uniref:porin n=1 Tax=Basfia succiniciproducens TaxID=653940 RepID=UPI003FCDB7BC
MKKTIIALITSALFFSGGASAITVYSAEGTKVNLDGRASFELINRTDKRSDLIDRGSRVRIHAYQDIGSGFTALANVEIRFTKDGDIGNQIYTKRLYGGFQHKLGSLTFGKQALLADSIGYSNFTYELGKITMMPKDADKAVRLLTDWFYGFRFGADYVFGTSEKYDDSDRELANKNRAYELAMFYNNKFGEFNVKGAVAYSQQKAGTLAKDEYDKKAMSTSVQLGYGKGAVGFDWTKGKSIEGKKDFKFRVGNNKFEEINLFEVGAKYAVTDKNNVYAEYLWGTGEIQGQDDGKFKGWFLGADHQFNKRVVTYLEGGSFKTKRSGDTLEKEKRIALGLRVYF